MLREKDVRVHEIGISVFSPFTPMLGERGAPDQVFSNEYSNYKNLTYNLNIGFSLNLFSQYIVLCGVSEV